MKTVQGVEIYEGKEKIEGDPDGWHIRLCKKIGEIETWALYCGDRPESSETSKATALSWMPKG